MTPQALLIVIAWLPFTLYLFTIYNPRTASIISFIGGLLFLPQRAGINLPLIPDFSNATVAVYGITLGLLIFDFQKLLNFQFSPLDLPMLIWTLTPITGSLANGLGLYDGINQAVTQLAIWGWPYMVGRLYLNSLSGMSELAVIIIKAGLIYVPLCIYEVRMSPRIHLMVYGYFPHSSGLTQAIRLGGWRPMVFMSHGLVLAMWMMVVTLAAIWLWQSKKIQKIWSIPIVWIVIILVVNFILIKSTGAYVYLAIGIIIFFEAKFLKTSFCLFVFIGLIIFYLFLNISGNFDGDSLISFLSNYFPPDRIESLDFRFDNEVLLSDKAREKLLFGWGGWGRSRIFEENWQGDIVDVSVTDSFWIIIFGNNGVLGIISLYSSLLLPVFLFALKRFPARTWLHPEVVSSAVLSVSILLFTFDSLFNVSLTAVYPLICGGITGIVAQPARRLNKVSPTQLSSQSRRRAEPLKR